MIKKNCVFVIGAGASQVYGLSSGNDLKNRILDLLSNPDEILSKAFPRSKIEIFQRSLLKSGCYSVDAFLENSSKFVDIGKFTISKIIASQEDTGRLFCSLKFHPPGEPHDYQIEGDWLQYLFSLMKTDFNNFQNNNVQFITYNYDRVIETYFFETLKNSFGKTDEEVANIINSFKIIHLHGQLGYLPWQNAEKNKQRAYGQGGKIKNELIDDINIGASEIKIIHEANPNSSEFSDVKEILKNASSIIFLGFGYSPQNIERLKLETHNKNIWGTVKGLTNAEIEGINRKHFKEKEISFYPGIDCLELLRRLDRSIFNDYYK